MTTNQTKDLDAKLNALPIQDWIDLFESRVALLAQSFSEDVVDPEISCKLRGVLDDVNWIIEHNA